MPAVPVTPNPIRAEELVLPLTTFRRAISQFSYRWLL
jgi:hypothetical protein